MAEEEGRRTPEQDVWTRRPDLICDLLFTGERILLEAEPAVSKVMNSSSVRASLHLPLLLSPHSPPSTSPILLAPLPTLSTPIGSNRRPRRLQCDRYNQVWRNSVRPWDKWRGRGGSSDGKGESSRIKNKERGKRRRRRTGSNKEEEEWSTTAARQEEKIQEKRRRVTKKRGEVMTRERRCEEESEHSYG